MKSEGFVKNNTPPQTPLKNLTTAQKPNLSFVPEKLINISTNLYTATISSVAGGTIQSFNLNNYFTADSQLVDMISQSSKSFEITGKDLDGNPLVLDMPWELHSNKTNPKQKNQKIVYRHELFPNKYIYKTLFFWSENYFIDVVVDLTAVSNTIFRDISFGWSGGLPSTESNLADDLSYFNSYVSQGGELENLKVGPGETEQKKLNGETSWAALRTKYFTTAIIPESPKDVRSATLTGTGDSLEVYGLSFVFDPIKKQTFKAYVGPLEYDRIKTLDVQLESIMDFGWAFIRPISKGVLFALKKMHETIPNYGFVLIVFAFLVKALVYPLTKKSYQSTSAMQAIQPEVSALKEKHKSNPQKLNQATMELYKAKGVNPLGGCLPMLLQMPLLFALFVVFRTTIELRSEPFVWWIKDLSAPDAIFTLPFNIPIYGSHVAVLPILMVISMFIQQKMMTGPSQQPQQKTMQYFMTAFFFLMFNGFPSGLNLYYTLFNVLTIAQQKLIPTDKQTL
jgi:YidC/Oxa1 family membrane protein insertase